MPRTRRTLLVSVAALLVAAPAAAADCPGADLQPSAANAAEVRGAVLCLTNEQRAAAGLPALAAQGELEAAAQAYTQRMVSERFFDHVGPDGSTLAQRLSAYVDWSTIGENIAWGEGSLGTARSTVRSWMESPGHRANLLSEGFTEVGIGVVAGTPTGSARAAATYTADYGARRAAAAGAETSSYGQAPAQGGTLTPGGAPRQAPGTARASGTAAAKPVAAKPAAAKKPAAKKPAPRCRKGTVRRVTRTKAGRRISKCVRVARARRS